MNNNIIEEVKVMCKKKNVRYEIINDLVFLYTNYGEWYFDPEKRSNDNYVLFHKNYRGAPSRKFCNSYHQQKVNISDLEELITYIAKHDRKIMQKRKPCSLDRKFKKIEKQLGRCSVYAG